MSEIISVSSDEDVTVNEEGEETTNYSWKRNKTSIRIPKKLKNSFATRIEDTFKEIFVEKSWCITGNFPYQSFKSLLDDFRRFLFKYQRTKDAHWWLWRKLLKCLISIQVTEYDVS